MSTCQESEKQHNRTFIILKSAPRSPPAALLKPLEIFHPLLNPTFRLDRDAQPRANHLGRLAELPFATSLPLVPLRLLDEGAEVSGFGEVREKSDELE